MNVHTGSTTAESQEPLIRSYLQDASATILSALALAPQVSRLAGICLDVLRRQGMIAWAGNGGSASQAQHLATELTVRFKRERPALAGLALNADGVTLTAAGNDYGFEQVFARQVEAFLHPGDLLILLTTSGRSPNLLAAARAARRKEVVTWALTGPLGSPLAAEVDGAIAVEAPVTAHIQEVHLVLGHILCEIIDRQMAPAIGVSQAPS